MKFLLTNDDGIDAPGLATLERALLQLGDVIVVAPDEHLSGCSHQATVRRPLQLSERDANRFALDGTPVDCTRVGLSHLAEDIDWVISGVNAGGNLGADVYMSGTVAAVREAALLGKPGIAISQFVSHRRQLFWERAEAWSVQVIQRLLREPHEAGCFWNVNLPDPDDPQGDPQVVVCPLDPHPMPIRFTEEDGRLHYRATYQERQRQAGCDVDVCFSGSIALTQLRLG